MTASAMTGCTLFFAARQDLKFPNFRFKISLSDNEHFATFRQQIRISQNVGLFFQGD